MIVVTRRTDYHFAPLIITSLSACDPATRWLIGLSRPGLGRRHASNVDNATACYATPAALMLPRVSMRVIARIRTDR